MMEKVKKVGVLSFAKFQTLMFGLVGLFLGILYSFGGLLIDALVSLGWVESSETPGLSFGTVLAFGALVGMPAIGAVIGFAAGTIEALTYNLFAKWFGGISMYFES